MKIDHLQPFAEPVVEKPVCKSCKTYTPTCLVPVGDGAVPMCWECAHHVIEHDTPVEHAYVGECECAPTEIYPARVLATRNLRLGVAHGDVDYTNLKPGDWTRQSELSAAVAERNRQIVEAMTPKQREVVLAAYTRGARNVSAATVAERAAGYKSTALPKADPDRVDSVVLVGDKRKLVR